MAFGLSEKTIRILQEILQRHPEVEQAVIYGSRAKGTYRTGSDIDLTLIGSALTHKILLEIQREMDEAPIPYAIDLSIYHEIHDPAVRDHIQRRGRVFFEKAG